MKKQIAIALGCVLLSLPAIGQDRFAAGNSRLNDSAASRKTNSLTGRVSSDARNFVSDPDTRIWTVLNPDALKGYEGQIMTLKCHENEISGTLQVVSAKARKTPIGNAPNLGDAAFRR